jgi:hypothetical protein
VPNVPEPWRAIPRPSDEETPLYETNTDAPARKHSHESCEARLSPPSSLEKRDDQSLFRDPTMTGPIDFGSEEGFTQAAKKKKKAAASNWDEPEKDDSKKEEGDGNNGDAKDGDKATGDTGAGAGDDDKKDDTNGDGTKEADPADAWDSFLPAKGKKKGKKGAKIEEAIAAPDPPPAAEFDAFHEINLDTGPSLDLTFGDTSTKSSSFGSWGSSWNTGTTRYV